MTKKNSTILTEVAGWYGACAILVAYFLVSFQLVPVDGIIFQVLNLTGSLGIIVVSVRKRVTQSVVLNIVWVGIAIVSLGRMLVQ